MESKTAIKLPSDQIRYSKSHVQYWQVAGRLYQQRGSTDFCCRFSHNGERGFFDLYTSNRNEAAKRAAERYRFVVAHGWESAAANPDFRVQQPQSKQRILTVGMWITEVRGISQVRPITLLSYEQALRRIAAEAVLGLTYSVKTHEKWSEMVDSMPLAKLSGNAVAKWIKSRLEGSVSDPKAREKAKHTVNHVLRSAKALFSVRKVVSLVAKDVTALLPEPLPFSEVSLLEEDSSARFTPSVDAEQLLVRAKEELGGPRIAGESVEDFELRQQKWIAFLLSFCAGLRRKESDLLEWPQVQLETATGPRIKLETTEFFSPKNQAHAKAIPLDLEVAEILKAYQKVSSGSFVLKSDRYFGRNGVGKPRCYNTWQALYKWLKAQGVKDRNPVHSLRKSVGALMAKKHGIHAAQRLLRHTTPTITSKYYSDSEARETPGIGSLLKR
ncbi:tyrosine-type recombinase/integrase [Prosthecobacter dejongeii]|uniref:Integrase n=1 Tax=Prosthecobacter dejongeii TaxID=48465 RepID=A0A7W7YPI0_9BACT|nr:tyrosine-type recombinase/integrase [Prosthecobacter dejongeii]MBB5039854.1 integrase [Prosthecobacter dejongeii]